MSSDNKWNFYFSFLIDSRFEVIATNDELDSYYFHVFFSFYSLHDVTKLFEIFLFFHNFYLIYYL